MIEKDPGVPLLSRLRVIHLYEADYNLLLKLLWSRRLTWNAHLNNTLHHSQSGSRPGRKAIDVVIFKELKYLYSTLTRTPLLTMDNDAKACFDRIPCNLAMMTSKYYGMPVQACDMQAKTLKGMEFHLRTGLGVSQNHYQHSPTTPVHGSGQGSCASPTLWLIISSLLMKCLDSVPGMEMHSITKLTLLLRSIIDGFVDDTSLFINLPFHQACPQEGLRRLRIATQKWAELLAASGGKLEITKCFYYAMFWIFSAEGDPVLTTMQQQQEMQMDTSIWITDPDTGALVEIKQKECKVPHRTLGVQKTTTGNDTTQYKTLLQRSNNMAMLAAAGPMSRHQARISYSMLYIQAMVYCLPACSFSRSQLLQVQAKSLEYFLPAMGWRRTTSRALIHGPIELGGLNIPNLYAVHGAVKILTIYTHIQAESDIGTLLVININWLQLLIGRQQQFFNDPRDISYIPTNWLLHVKDFLTRNKLSIRSHLFWTPSTSRLYDANLMEAAWDYTHNKTHLRYINNWRLYFNAFNLSDLCDGSGKCDLECYRVFTPSSEPSHTRRSKLNWPTQAKPNKPTFRIWEKFLKEALGMQAGGMLPKQLESWTESVEASINFWEVYYDPSSATLWQRKDYYYNQLPIQVSNRLGGTFSTLASGSSVSLPPGVYPATTTNVRLSRLGATFSTFPLDPSIAHSLPTDGTSPPTFEEYLVTKPTWEKDLCSNWNSESKEYILQNLLPSSPIPFEIAADGQYNKTTLTYGTVLAIGGEILFKNSGKVVRSDGKTILKRSKLTGILSALVSTRLLLEFFHYSPERIKTAYLWCNHSPTTSRITRGQQEGVPIGAHSLPDIDLILQIRQELLKLQDRNIYITLRFYKTTTNKAKNKDINYDPQGILLQLASDMAAQASTGRVAGHDKSYSYPANNIAVMRNGRNIQDNLYRQIIQAETAPALIEFMKEKYNWTETTVDRVWWKAHESALITFKPAARQIIQKFNHDQWATNSREASMFKFRQKTCEICGRNDETSDHVIQCDNIERQKGRDDLIQELDQYFKRTKTPASIGNAFIHGLTAWMRGDNTPHIDTVLNVSDLLRKTYREQTTIGWRQLLRGHLSRGWYELIQQEITKTTNYPDPGNQFNSRSAAGWGKKVISILWTNVLKIWEARNSRVQQIYVDQGLSRDNEIMIQTAENEINTGDLPTVEYKDRDWLFKTKEELRKMHRVSLGLWVQNIRKLKKLFKNKIGQE